MPVIHPLNLFPVGSCLRPHAFGVQQFRGDNGGVTSQTDSPRIVFVDIDGTLVEHGYPVSPATIEAIQTARSNGHQVFICTGRGEVDIPSEIRDIGFDGEITNGGALARVGGAEVFSSSMSEEMAQHALDYLKGLDVGLFLQSIDQSFADERALQLTLEFDEQHRKNRDDDLRAQGIDPETVPYVTTFGDVALTFPPLEDAAPGEIVKIICVSNSEENIDRLVEDLGPDFHIIPGSMPLTAGSSAEICAPGMTKGFAITEVLNHLGIEARHSVGIGDSWNDYEMFQVVNDAVVMANADPDLKVHANYETDTVYGDGLAKAFDMLGLV